MSSPQQVGSAASDYVKQGWDAALSEMRHLAAQLEARGALRSAVTLYDAIRIVEAGGLPAQDRDT